jgi:selenocysteine-specific elongation factor
MPHIIGTAGHIDHGKTALIKVLTGHDTDRLKEEKERGISIDLGFAYLDLPNDERVGVVDVPGHERFIGNMLAGAHGIDLVLFTIAADDGVMPQSEEHLDILHLLGVRKGIFAITKADLVEPDRLDAVREEIEILTLDTTLEGAPIIAVSSVTGMGVDQLRQEIAHQLQGYERPFLPGYFRLPVDRAFIMKGHGVVVTGTAVAGVLSEGETVRVLPGGETVRVRSIQVHGQSVSTAHWGRRVALNLAGLEKSGIARGHVVCHPKVTLTTQRFDAFVEIRPGARREIKNHEQVRIHLGTAEAMGKLILLNGQTVGPDVLAPASSAFCQIALDAPMVALRGDRFIMRGQTAQRTLGGGEVVNPFARRYRRTEQGVTTQLASLRAADLVRACFMYLEMQSDFASSLEELYQGVNGGEDEVADVLAQDPQILSFPDSGHPEAYTTVAKWQRLAATVTQLLTAFHTATPLARGMEMESLRSQLPFAFSPKLFRAVTEKLVADGVAVREDSTLHLPSHRVTLNEHEQETSVRLEQLLQAGGFTPPELKALEAECGAPRKVLSDLLSVLESRGAVVKVTADLYLSSMVLEKAKAALVEYLSVQSEMSAATFRDLLGVSRKTAIPLLEYFDRSGLTLRVGDVRKLRK